MSFLLSLSLLASTSGGVALAITSPQKSVLVGEPVKLMVTWKTPNRPARLYLEDQTFLAQSLVFLVNNGSGVNKYREFPKGLVEHIGAPTDLPAGGEAVRNLVLVRGGYVTDVKSRPTAGLLFPTKGKYSLKAVYVEGGQWVESNSLSFTVAEPIGVDRQILDLAARAPLMLEAAGPADAQAKAKELSEEHPASPYLRWTRILLLEQRAAALHNEYDPDTKEPLFRLEKGKREEFKADRHRQMAEEILDEGDWGPFEEEALALALRYAEAGGDQSAALRARKELFDKHPRSATVKEIKEAEADDEDEPSVKPSPKPRQ